MKTKVFIFFSLLICNLLPAQNVKLDIVPHFFGVRADSLLLSMDISIHIDDMDSKSAFMLTPVLTSQEKKVLLPHIQLNGKQKQKLYLRNQILRKKNDRKEEDAKAYLIAGIDENHSRTISYRTSLPAEDWMSNATLTLKRTIVRPEGEQSLKDTIVITPQNIVASSGTIVPSSTATQEIVSLPAVNERSVTPAAGNKMKYKGAYVSPETDDVDARNQKELNFSLEEAKMIAEINPQMLSLRELYTVALSYTEDKARFYKIINISVKLYPVHPVANLNAAAAAIEQGDVKSAGKFLSMALHDSLAYKNRRGVYELMSGNTYEGIRMLKAAKAEGSEEAAYNLNAFFENNKRP